MPLELDAIIKNYRYPNSVHKITGFSADRRGQMVSLDVSVYADQASLDASTENYIATYSSRLQLADVATYLNRATLKQANVDFVGQLYAFLMTLDNTDSNNRYRRQFPFNYTTATLRGA